VSRLRLELRDALTEVNASRSRLVAAAAEERHRLERDLHDGAQQHLVSIGMRLRSVQHRLRADLVAYRDLDEAVLGLEQTIAELRRIAHGVRPSRLDDGVGGARAGFGLTSLRDRIASVGGELTLHSPAGAGTSVRAEIPCAS
jgi:signal transduction histidine kinase